MLKKIILAIVVVLAAFIGPNLRSLYEGIIFYLRDVATHNPASANPVQRGERYASLYDLVEIRNMERRAYILARLKSLGVTVTEIPIPNSTQTSIFVTFSSSPAYTVFSAHYDKLFDEIEYQGASDNTASVSVMLASIAELAHRNYHGGGAFLFTGEEEHGLRGSQAFVAYARDAAHLIGIKENINFDNLGRGKLGIRPSATVPGFAFALPFLGEFTYDGREIRPSPPYPFTPARLTQALVRAQPETTVYERFTAVSDSNVFQSAGIDTVAISGDNIRFLELTWHAYADRVELLDEKNLDLAYDLILRYAPEN